VIHINKVYSQACRCSQ